MEWFRIIVSNQELSGTVFDINLAGFNPVGYKKIADVYVSSSLSALRSSIHQELHGALVILENYIVVYFEALCSEIVPGPQDLWHQVVNGNKFGLGGAFCV